MEHNEISPRQRKLLHNLTYLPHKIVSFAGKDNITEFVLHDLCNTNCFNLRRAAYLIDNPDFNCLKGIAGFSQEEMYQQQEDIWIIPEDFTNHMRKCAFNNKVRSITCESKVKKGPFTLQAIEDVAMNLGFQSCTFASWDIKHQNQGLLIYEKADTQDCEADEYLQNGLSLLSFCPVY